MNQLDQREFLNADFRLRVHKGRDNIAILQPEIQLRSEPDITAFVVASDHEFDNLEKEWNDLVERSRCTVFQTFEWQRSWWKYCGKNRELHCLVFRERDEIVGIAPMYRQKVKFLGIPVARLLGFFSEWYVDLIALPAKRETVVSSLVDYLYSNERLWDIFEIRDANERFPTLNLLQEHLRNGGLKTFSYRGETCLQVALARTWEDFLQNMGTGRQRRFKRRLKKLQENFKFEFEAVKGRDDEVDFAVDEFARIYNKRWISLGYKSWFANENNIAFEREVAEKFARRGWLRMFFLKVDGTRAATVFDFNFGDRIYGYQSNVYAPPEVMKCSPGLLLHYAAARQGIEEGMEVFDLLRGTQPYKYEEFECTSTANWQVRAAYPSGAHLARFWMFIALETLRKVFFRIRTECHDVRRIKLTKGLTPRALLAYISKEAKDVVGHSIRFFSSVIPARRHGQ